MTIQRLSKIEPTIKKSWIFQRNLLKDMFRIKHLVCSQYFKLISALKSRKSMNLRYLKCECRWHKNYCKVWILKALRHSRKKINGTLIVAILFLSVMKAFSHDYFNLWVSQDCTLLSAMLYLNKKKF